MRKVILASFVITTSSLLVLIYEKGIVGDFGFGSGAILIATSLAVLSLFSLYSMFAYQSDKREAIQKIWLSVTTTLLAYLIMDVVLGYFLIPRLSPPLLQDEYVHHALAPNTRSQFRSHEFAYIQDVNSLGLRGPELQLNKKPGTYRILMLGDSFTMGKGVDDDKTFSVVLEQSLNRKNAAINGNWIFQVLNAGVDSYSPILSFLQLKRMAAPLDPDMVVFNLDMSDVIQEVAYRNAARYGSNGEIVGISSSAEGEYANGHDLALLVRDWIDRNLYVTRLILYYAQKSGAGSSALTIRNTVIVANAQLLKHTLSDDTEDRTEQYQKLFASILSMKKFCDSRAIRFILTVYPWGHQVNEREWTPGRRAFVSDGVPVSDKTVNAVEDFAKANSITLLNVFGAFRSYKGERLLYYSYDMHWTPAGHELMARELDRVLSKQ